MTTIAYKDGVLAFDGRVVEGGLIVTDNNVKGLKTRDHLIAAAGHAGLCDAFLSWVQNGFKQTDIPECKNAAIESGDFTGIIVDTEGFITTYDENFLPINMGQETILAAGSGKELAFSAMHLGQTAIEAVQFAARFDVNTGGKIQSVTFKKVVKVKPVIVKPVRVKKKLNKKKK